MVKHVITCPDPPPVSPGSRGRPPVVSPGFSNDICSFGTVFVNLWGGGTCARLRLVASRLFSSKFWIRVRNCISISETINFHDVFRAQSLPAFHWFPLVPSWFLLGCFLVPSWFPVDFPFIFPLGSLLVPSWFPLGSLLDSSWFPLGSLLVPLF